VRVAHFKSDRLRLDLSPLVIDRHAEDGADLGRRLLGRAEVNDETLIATSVSDATRVVLTDHNRYWPGRGEGAMATQSFHPFRSEQAKAEYEARYAEMAKAWPVPFDNLLIDTPSARTFVRASGRPSDPPLVLLPGTRGTSLMWVHMIAALSASHRTYALDNVNDVGMSVRRRENWPPEALVEWLDEVFRVLVPEGTLDLMGMSYGGWLASLYALRFPQRVRKVVLLAPGGTVLRLSFGFFMRVMAILAVRVPGASEDTLRRVLRWVFEDAFRRGEACRRYMEGDLTWMLKAGRYFVLPKLVWPTVLDDDAWRRWSVPCLFLVGEHERIYSPQAALKRLRRVAPLVEAEMVPGAGHDLTLVQADLVAKRVLEFLEKPIVRPVQEPHRAERPVAVP
jgi:pimeloyl-ACP methyl ester carboxylesterase